jgi:D-alanyl-D-alanine carboxypeptidase
MSKLRAGRVLALMVGLVLTALALGGAVVQARPEGARAAAARFDPATVAAMTSIVKGSMASSGTPGMAVGVWIPGRGNYIRTFGTADVKTSVRGSRSVITFASRVSPRPSRRP